MMRIYLLMIIWLVAYFPVIAQNQPIAPITLQECVEIALKNNSDLKRNELALKRDQINFNQSRYNLLPALSASASHGINQGRSVDPTTNQFTENTFSSGSQGLSADLTLFNGFRALHDIRMKAAAREAGKLEFENYISEFKLDVIEAYVQALTARDLLAQINNQLTVTLEQLRRAEIMHKEGGIAPGDYFDIRGQVKNDENQVEASKKALHDARLRLARLMQTDESDLGELAPLDIRLDSEMQLAESLYETAKETLPIVQALDHRILESKQQIGVVRAAFYPSLSMGAGLNSYYSDSYNTSYRTQFDQNLGKYVSIGLRIPIFNRMQNINQVKQAKLQYEESQLQKEIQLQALKEEVSKAVFDLRTTKLTLENLRGQVADYNESFRIATVQFEAGASNSFLFLSAKNKADAAKQQFLIKQYEYVLQQYINDYYQGNLF